MVYSVPQLEPAGQATPDAVWHSPIAAIAVYTSGQQLVGVRYLPLEIAESDPRNPFAARVIDQIERYFADPDWRFELPLRASGTPFQERAWGELRRISRGSVKTYGGLAAILTTSPRAVGGACRANPCPLITPCHRVVSAQGLGGFMGHSEGQPSEIKRWLLRHEGAIS